MSASSSSKPVVYHTSPFLVGQKDNGSSSPRTALVVLNSPIPKNGVVFPLLWNWATIRACADGGANRLYEADPTLIPDLIRGDLDSLQPSVRDYYEQRGTRVEQDFDQDTNDLDKVLQVLHKQLHDKDTTTTIPSSAASAVSEQRSFDWVIIYGAFGGRFDQEMASLQALYIWGSHFQHKLVLMTDETSAILLPPDVRNEIRISCYDQTRLSNIGEGPTCGLIPLGSRCEACLTTGLKWNLDGETPLEFGGLVSTSNRVMDAVVTVEASHPLVFTNEITTSSSP